MSNRLKEVAPNICGIKRAFLTEAGHELMDVDPDAIDAFLEFGYKIKEERSRWASNCIGRGNLGVVCRLPGNEDLCVKVCSKHTKADDYIHSPTQNLLTETKFMDAVAWRFYRRGIEDVKVPTQFAAVKFSGGYASLQECVPRAYETIDDLRYSGVVGSRMAHEYGLNVIRRTKSAIGYCALRLGVKELGDKYGVHGGNILAHKESIRTGSGIDAYIVDLIGPMRWHHLVANIAS